MSAYRFAKQRRVWWPIKVAVPVDHEGVADEAEVELLYQMLDQDDLMRLMHEAPLGGADEKSRLAGLLHRFGRQQSDLDKLAARIFDWRNVLDQHGNPIPFSEQALRDVLGDPYFLQAATLGLISCSMGAPRKNSLAGHAGSTARPAH